MCSVSSETELEKNHQVLRGAGFLYEGGGVRDGIVDGTLTGWVFFYG